MTDASSNRRIVGLKPWLPWPLSAWSWWTEPVRAERLALLRIGVALCVLLDLSVYYGPGLLDYFAKGSLGDAEFFYWQSQPPRTGCSLLRGVGDQATTYLALTAWILLGGWTLGLAFARLVLIRRRPPADDRSGIALVLA